MNHRKTIKDRAKKTGEAEKSLFSFKFPRGKLQKKKKQTGEY